MDEFGCSPGRRFPDPVAGGIAHMESLMDRLIAASALAVGCPVVTHNIDHFGRVPGLETQDWTV